jgi:hypothetical protein
MRLSTEQLQAGWLHPNRIVRNAGADFFTDTFTTDPAVTALAIRAAQEFGWERFLTWDYKFCKLPLADDEALEWVCGEVERIDEAAPSNNLKWHLTTMLAKAEIPLLERHRERLLAVPGLQRRERQAIETRLELADCSPADAWRRLEDHCRLAPGAETFAEARIPEAELLLEPLVRAGTESVARVMDVLQSPPPESDGDDPAEWLTGLMITLAGRLRLEAAAAAIWKLTAIDWDWYEGECLEALKRIGTPAVVNLARGHYPNAPWNTRLQAACLFADIHCDESVAAIAEAVRDERDDDLRARLGVAAASHFDDRLVPLARAVFEEDPSDPERGDMREPLIAFSYLSGQDFPERDKWERDVNELDDRMRLLGDPASSPLAAAFLQRLQAEADGDDEDDPVDLGLGNWIEDDQLRIERGSVIGRNEPCPCGSGKKYKRCCLPAGSG